MGLPLYDSPQSKMFRHNTKIFIRFRYTGYSLISLFQNQLSVTQIKHLISVQHVLKEKHAKTILMNEMD